MNSEETACPFCGGETALVTESVSDRCRKQRRKCKECGSPFLTYVGKQIHVDVCDVPGCPGRAKCQDKDRPQACALYRMMKRGYKVTK